MGRQGPLDRGARHRHRRPQGPSRRARLADLPRLLPEHRRHDEASPVRIESERGLRQPRRRARPYGARGGTDTTTSWLPLGMRHTGATSRLRTSSSTSCSRIPEQRTFACRRRRASAQCMAIFMSSCDARRIGQWENTNWAEFTRVKPQQRRPVANLILSVSEFAQASKNGADEREVRRPCLRAGLLQPHAPGLERRRVPVHEQADERGALRSVAPRPGSARRAAAPRSRAGRLEHAGRSHRVREVRTPERHLDGDGRLVRVRASGGARAAAVDQRHPGGRSAPGTACGTSTPTGRTG